MTNMIVVGGGTITAGGGASQQISINNKECRGYRISFRSTGAATPAAGSTSVAWKPLGGDAMTLKYSNGTDVNVDPTLPTPIAIGTPLDALFFTPSGWTANSALTVTVFGEP